MTTKRKRTGMLVLLLGIGGVAWLLSQRGASTSKAAADAALVVPRTVHDLLDLIDSGHADRAIVAGTNVTASEARPRLVALIQAMTGAGAAPDQPGTYTTFNGTITIVRSPDGGLQVAGTAS